MLSHFLDHAISSPSKVISQGDDWKYEINSSQNYQNSTEIDILLFKNNHLDSRSEQLLNNTLYNCEKYSDHHSSQPIDVDGSLYRISFDTSIKSSPIVPKNELTTDIEIDKDFLTSEIGEYYQEFTADHELKQELPTIPSNLQIVGKEMAATSDVPVARKKRKYTKGKKPVGRPRKKFIERRTKPGKGSVKSERVVKKVSSHQYISSDDLTMGESLDEASDPTDDEYMPGSAYAPFRASASKQRTTQEVLPEKKRRLGARSKTGCWTCRIRHKSCPEDRPSCGQCQRLKLVCDYSVSRPSYMYDPALHSRKLREIREITNEQKKCNLSRKKKL